jgi:peptidoglycan/xylan/chitin deacetylase (PgdA/CDA1 family)/SAM-dependent methyltransferase
MLIFRYDDYSAAERIKFEIDETIFRTFQTNQIPLTVAVTPQMVSDVHDASCESFVELGADQRRVDLLRERLAGGWELALHGLTHRRSAVRDYTEFAMRSRRVQSALLRTGREKLATWFPNARLRTFVPPWNSYDSVTIEEAATNEFEVLCAGPDAKPTVKAGVRIIPSVLTIDDLLSFEATFSLPRLLEDLGGVTAIVTLHEYEFRADGQPRHDRLQALEGLISRIAQAQIPCGGVSAAVPADCDASRLERLQAHLRLARKVSGPAAGRFTSLVSAVSGVAAHDAVEGLLDGGAVASYQLQKLTRTVRQKARPAWTSVQRLRRVAAGRIKKGPQYDCSFCGFHGVFGLTAARPHAVCPSCGSLERHRFIAATVGPMLRQRQQNGRAMMLAPDPLLAMLRSSFKQVFTGDIAAKNVDVTFDLQKLPFRSGALDLILAIHVLDEIEDDRAALRECRRVLSDGGWLIAPVPVLAGPSTLELEERREDGKIRLAGDDYTAKILAEGFSVVAAFEPLDASFADLHRRQNVRTPNCIEGAEGVIVFAKSALS